MRWVACGIELDYFAHVGRAYSQRRPPASSHLGVGNDLKVVSGEVRQICRDEQGRLPKSATQSPQHKVRNRTPDYVYIIRRCGVGRVYE